MSDNIIWSDTTTVEVLEQELVDCLKKIQDHTLMINILTARYHAARELLRNQK